MIHILDSEAKVEIIIYFYQTPDEQQESGSHVQMAMNNMSVPMI